VAKAAEFILPAAVDGIKVAEAVAMSLCRPA
jgi:uncharacterized FAD-dependent dehydrogenase